MSKIELARYFMRTLFMLLLSFLLGFSMAEHLYKKQFFKPQPQPECTHERQAPPQDDQTRAVG